MSSPLAAPRALPRPSAWLCRPLVVVAAAWAASEVVAGSFFGFGAVASHVRFWMLGVLVVLAAFMLADRLSPSPSYADRIGRRGYQRPDRIAGALTTTVGHARREANPVVTLTSHVAGDGKKPEKRARQDSEPLATNVASRRASRGWRTRGSRSGSRARQDSNLRPPA